MSIAEQTPVAIDVRPDGIPAELRALPRWVCWKFGKGKNGKPTKHPYQACKPGTLAASDNPATWAAFDKALATYLRGGFAGIGFMLGDGFAGVDLDHCLDPATNELDPWAGRIAAEFGTYTEISPSGTGLKLICKGSFPVTERRANGKLKTGGNSLKLDGKALPAGRKVEAYHSERYFALTGHTLKEYRTPAIEKRPAQCVELWYRMKGKPATATRPTSKPSPSTNGSGPTDAEIISKASTCASGDKFFRLWAGDCSGHGDDHSSADLALCDKLAFWTGPNPGRIDQLFRQSGLMRDKWERDDYRQWTIDKALDGRTEFYKWNGNGQHGGERKSKPANQDLKTADESKGHDGHLKTSDEQGGHLDHVDGEALPNLWEPEGRTDSANARRLGDLCGDSVHWCEPWGKWLAWDGKRWRMDQQLQLDKYAKRNGRQLFGEVAKAAGKVEKELLAEFIRYAKASSSANGVRNALALFRSEPGIPVLPDQLDQHPWYLNVANGTLDLKTGKLLPHNRGHLITKLCPVVFDAAADCPLFVRFVREIMADNQALIGFLRRYVGYCLTGAILDHVLVFMYGTGANGKSTLVNLLLALLGDDYSMKAPPDLLLAKRNESHPTERADLHGKRFVACIETEDGRRLAESLVKELTGGDRIRARRMREDFWEFNATHKIALAGNHKPVIKGTDHGIWRRVKLLPFTVTIADAEQDKHLPEKLLAELPGILNWALLGLTEYLDKGLCEPDEVKAATGEYRQEMDTLATFIDEKCELGTDLEAASADLYKSYQAWCEASGERPMKQRDFGIRLTERGLERERGGHGKHVRKGIALAT